MRQSTRRLIYLICTGLVITVDMATYRGQGIVHVDLDAAMRKSVAYERLVRVGPERNVPAQISPGQPEYAGVVEQLVAEVKPTVFGGRVAYVVS